MAHNNEQALVPAPADYVLMIPRLTLYLYNTINELELLCVKTLPPNQDYRIEGDRFMKQAEVATTNEEKDWMNDFLTEDEINLTGTPQGLSVRVIDKYENLWPLRLKRNNDENYILSGILFPRFKMRQRFTPGWIFHLWVTRGNAGQVLMAIDFNMGNRN